MPRFATVCLLGGLVLPALLAPAASGAPEQDYFLGEAWESAIVRGVEDQRRAERRRTPADTLVGRAERAARRDPSVVKLYLLARAYGLRAQWHRAQAAETRDADAQAKRRAAASRDQASAVATYQDVLRQAARCYFAHHDMGILEMQRDTPDTRAAFTHFSNAYAINRRYTPSQRQLIQLYIQGKQYREAIPLLQRLLQLEPEDEEARGRLIVALAGVDRYDEAYRELDAVLAKDPSQPRSLAVRAHLDTKTGRFDRAIDTYKRLTRLNPNVPTAFIGILECCKLMEAKGLEVDLEDYLFALKGLKRMIRDLDERKKIADQIREIEHAIAMPAGGASGPPTLAQLLHGLQHPDESIRRQALLALTFRKEPATREILRAVARHMDPQVESSPIVRAGAVKALGMLSGTVLVPLLRLKLLDEDVRVGRVTVDTLIGIASRDTRAGGPVIAILGPQTRNRDVELASAARLGILRLAGAVLPGLDDESDDAAHRRAFERWWSSAEGETIQIEALDEYHVVRDKAAHDVLLPYLEASSYHVFRAAHRALARAGDTAGSAALKGWHASMPRWPEASMTKANWPTQKSAMQAWVARRPSP